MQGSGRTADWGRHFQAEELGQHQGSLPTSRLRGPETLALQDFRTAVTSAWLFASDFPFQMKLFVIATLFLFTIVSLVFGEIICFFVCLF